MSDMPQEVRGILDQNDMMGINGDRSAILTYLIGRSGYYKSQENEILGELPRIRNKDRRVEIRKDAEAFRQKHAHIIELYATIERIWEK